MASGAIDRTGDHRGRTEDDHDPATAVCRPPATDSAKQIHELAVLGIMALPLAFPAPAVATAPQIVAGPRRTDAVGDTLRQAFRSPRALPDALDKAIRCLNMLD